MCGYTHIYKSLYLGAVSIMRGWGCLVSGVRDYYIFDMSTMVLGPSSCSQVCGHGDLKPSNVLEHLGASAGSRAESWSLLWPRGVQLHIDIYTY